MIKKLLALIMVVSWGCFGGSSAVRAAYQQARQVRFNFSENYGMRSVYLPLGLDDTIKFNPKDFANQQTAISVYRLSSDQVLELLVHQRHYLSWLNTGPGELNYELVAQTTLASLAANNYQLNLEGTGGWLVVASDGSKLQQTIVTKSSFASLAKNGDNNLVVWSQQLADGASLEHGQVRVYNLDGGINLLDEREVSESSVVVLPYYDTADAIVVTTETGWSLIPLGLQALSAYESEYDNGIWWYYSIYQPENNFYVFTDKPLYHFGETVHFKAVLRRSDDYRYSVIREPVTVRLYRGWYGNDDNLLFSHTYTPDEFGGIDGEYVLPASGDFDYVYVRVDEDGYASFQVAEYVKPEYELSVTPSADELISGDPLTASVTGASYAGHELAGMSFEYCWSSSECTQQWQTATFDDDGRATLSLPTTLPAQDDTQDHPSNGRGYTISVRYSDGVSEPAEDSHGVRIKYTPLSAQLDNNGYSFYQGDTVTVSGQLESERETVSLSKRLVKLSVVKDDYKNNSHPVVATLQTYSDENGRFSFGYQPSECASYSFYVKAYDNQGRFFATADYYSCRQQTDDDDYYGSSEVNDPASTLKIDIDQNTAHLPTDQLSVAYRVGENLVGRSYFLDFGRRRLDRYGIGRFLTTSDRVDYQLTTTDLPNTFHDVSLFDRNNYISTSSEVKMNKTLQQVKVEIITDQQTYAPGDTVRVRLKTTNQYTGRPLRASVTLWTVDQALYALASGHRSDVFDFFWRDGYHWIRTFHSLEAIMAGAEGGGGGGDDVIRELFKDTAYWNPNVITDYNGEASITFELPDNLTTWKLQAVAVTPDTVVGQAVGEIIVQKDIVARIIAPERLRVGDTSQLGIRVTNYTQQTQTLVPVWETGTGLADRALATDKLTLAPGETRDLTLPVVATAPITTTITAGVRNLTSGGPGDVLTKEIEILPFGYQQEVSQFALQAGSFDLGVAADSDLSRSRLTISVAGDVLGSLRTAMNELLVYPRGCVEQTTSRLVPIVLVRSGRLFDRANFDVDLDALASDGIKNLTKLQNSSGGWGFWEPRDDADAFKSAYVIKYLLQADSEATPVDDSVYRHAAGYFKNILASERQGQDADFLASFYTLLLLDRAQPELQIWSAETGGLGSADYYYNKIKNEMTPTAQDLLALAVQVDILMGDQAQAQKHLASLLAPYRGAASVEDALDESYYQRYRSDGADLALALQAVAAYQRVYGGQDEILQSLAIKLLGLRQQAGWSNTYATAQAIEALAAWSQLQPVTSNNGQYVVQLGEQTLGVVDFSGGVREQTLSLGLDEVQDPFAPLTVARRDGGEGTVFVTVTTDQWRTATDAPLLSDQLTITKAYVRDTANDDSTFSLLSRPQLAPGDIVTVYIGIDNHGPTQYFVAIDDYLPSNLRPLYRNNNAWANRTYTYTGFSGTLDRVSTGRTVVSYQALVTNLADQVSAPPTRVASMYDPDFRAQTAMTANVQIATTAPAWVNDDRAVLVDDTLRAPSASASETSENGGLVSRLVEIWWWFVASLLNARI